MSDRVKVFRAPSRPSSMAYGTWVAYCTSCGIAVPSFTWDEAMKRAWHHVDIHRKHKKWEESRCA